MARNYTHGNVPAFNSLGSSRVIRQEFDSVQSGFAGVEAEIDLKAPLASPTLTGTVVLPATTSIGSVSSTEISYLDGVTSGIQGQITAEVNARAAADADLESRKADTNGETYSGSHDFILAILTAATLPYGSSGQHVATVDYVNQASFQTELPSQTNNAGSFLTTDGTSASWGNFPDYLILAQGII